MAKYVSVSKENKVAVVTITREEALNALNEEVLSDLRDAFLGLGEDKDVRTIVVTGKGKSFVAGADIAQMSVMRSAEARKFTLFGQSVMEVVEKTRKPVIAAVNGFALGGGCELAMACDIRVASEKAIFGQPEVGLGIIPGFGGTQRLQRLVGIGMAKYLIYSGETIKADEALKIGLVEKTLPAENFLDEVLKIAEKIAAKAPVGVMMAKAAIEGGADIDKRTGIQIEAENASLCFETEDQKEGMKAFLEKRKPEFKGG